MFCLILEDTCTGICEEVHSSCDAVYEVPYSSPSSEDHGQLMVTNFRVTFVPYQSTNTEPVGCAVCSFFNTYIVIAVVSAANIRSYQEFWASCGKCSKYFTDTIESCSCQSYVKRGGGGAFFWGSICPRDIVWGCLSECLRGGGALVWGRHMFYLQ